MEFVMTSIPHLTKADVRRWTDDVYFQRGQKYFEQGLIYDQHRQGMTLKSKCSGTQAPFYRQEILFDNKGIKSADCSCPVGDGGKCKHAVALLLTWADDPDSFKEVEALDAALEKRSKPELIAIIKQMVEQEPDLESLLELPSPTEAGKPINLKAIRQQAQRAFRGTGYYDEWVNTREIEKDLKPLFKLAEGYLARNDASNAASIYQTIIETIMDNEDVTMSDEEGELLGVAFDCAESLGNCLPAITDRKRRRDLLQALFSLYEWDSVKLGGIGASDCVPEILTSRTTADERVEIAKWTRQILPKGTSWSNGYHREVLGRLLLDLEADTLDDEAYLKICRETGRLNDLIERLLKLNQIKEAEENARSAEDYDLLLSLNIFMQHNQADLAEKLVTERLEAVRGRDLDERLIEWLAERFKQRGDLASSLKLEERLFWKYPNLEKYGKLRKLANQLKCWENMHIHIVAELEKKKDFDFLITVHLEEKEVGNALALLEKLPSRWGDHTLHLEVANAAKKQYPQQALEIFKKEAERFINYRNRDSYSQAAHCLKEVRGIHGQLTDMSSWEKLIADIRGRYKKLPALQDELDQLKL
jgi:uncharacterized Zn finger protein